MTLTNAEYRAHPAISRSDLWKIRESPEKFKFEMENPSEPTPALLFGQAIHKLILQPETFDTEFAVAPDVDRRTKDGKAAFSAFLSESEGKGILTAPDYEKCRQMAEKCATEDFITKLLAGEHEKPYFWTDELTGEECKCRVDAIVEIDGTLIVTDYKSCSDASTDGFMRDAIKYGYHMQSAMYSAGVEKNTGKKPLFVFIAQEKNPPYAVNILQADPAFVEAGYDVFRELLGTYHYCKTNDDWFGYLGRQGIINNLSIPAWMTKGD